MTFDERELDSGTFIVVSGRIEFTDSLAPFELLASQGRARFVTFDSPGGSPYKAMDLGRLIRRYGLATVQIRSTECASACALAFMGGSTRAAMAGSIGVHRSSFSDTSSMPVDDAVSSVQLLTADTIAYMNEMGVDPSLLQLALQYGSDDIRYLSSSEMQRYRVVTGSETRRWPRYRPVRRRPKPPHPPTRPRQQRRLCPRFPFQGHAQAGSSTPRAILRYAGLPTPIRPVGLASTTASQSRSYR